VRCLRLEIDWRQRGASSTLDADLSTGVIRNNRHLHGSESDAKEFSPAPCGPIGVPLHRTRCRRVLISMSRSPQKRRVSTSSTRQSACFGGGNRRGKAFLCWGHGFFGPLIAFAISCSHDNTFTFYCDINSQRGRQKSLTQARDMVAGNRRPLAKSWPSQGVDQRRFIGQRAGRLI